MRGIEVKTEKELEIMAEGGKKLGKVKKRLGEAVKAGVNALEVEELACELIKAEGAKESFKMVPGYSWATCININDGVVHGIPKKTMVFKDGDLVSVDVGLYFKGYHLDTSLSVGVNTKGETNRFLEVGREALKKAISEAKPGKRIYDISEAIETTLRKNGYSPVKGLVGHGIGKKLHMYPYIPCETTGMSREYAETIQAGNTFAIEVMYAQGDGNIVLDRDGWTIKAEDGKITGLFEDTVAVTKKGPLVLTG